MLAGLIFATQDAADRPEALAATLPFGGATLIEYQARLLVAAGAAQLLVAVARVTPELLGAAARIQKRGVSVDVVRSAAEAADKVHPLARVVVVADGLLTTEAQLAPLAAEGDDALLVTDGDSGLERIDAASCWAGLARIGAQRLADTARMPRDYDFLSTLLRVAAQHGAIRLPLTLAARAEHGVERDTRGLARRGRAVFAELAGARERWVERWVLGPLARLTLPALVARGVSPLALLAAGGGVALLSLVAIWLGWIAGGLAGATVAAALLLNGGMLAWLRGDEADGRIAEWGGMALAAASVLAAGFVADRAGSGNGATGGALAVALVVAGGLVERVRTLATAQRWWPAPAAYPLLLIPCALAGQLLPGLAALGLYAAAAVLAGIEHGRTALARL